MTDTRFQRLRAVLRNALTWGAAWAAAGGAIATALSLFDPDVQVQSPVERLGLAVAAGIVYAVRFGVAGTVIGGVFAGVIRLGYRGRRLADIRPARFAMLGAAVGGVGVPLYLQMMNVLSGDGPIPWGLVLDDAPWAAAFGAVAAAGSILLARRADVLPPGPRPEQLERANDLDALPTAGQRETSRSPRSRSAPV